MNRGRAGGFRNVAASAMLGAAVAFALFLTALRGFEFYAGDLRLSHLADTVQMRRDMAIVAIDDAATRNLPFQSPVNRELLATIVEQLDQRGAKAIALDIVLDRPSFPEHDARLAAALAASNAAIILGRHPGFGLGAPACGGSSRDLAPLTANPDQPGAVLPVFAAHATLADIIVCIDGDGVVRTMPLDSTELSGLPAAMAAQLGKTAPADGRRIPFDLTPSGLPPVPIYSASQLEILPDDWIRGKAVFVGAVTPYSGDWFLTPLRFADVLISVEPADRMPEGELPGVMIHAFGAAALMDGRQGPGVDWGVALALALAGGVCGAALGVAPIVWWMRALAGVSLAVATPAAAFGLVPLGVLLPLTPFPMGLALAGGLAAAAEAQSLSAQRRMIRQAFERYLAPSVVSELIRNPSLVALGASEREISVLFTDLEGFTRFVDSNAPDQVVEVLNGYLNAIVAVVVNHGGAVDKIVGDAVHAIFSAPIHDPRHRENACACAFAIDAASQIYRAEVQKKFGIALGVTRIAVHSGRAMVGNFGGDRLDYTAHGSTINAVARLEAANKVFGTRVCASEASRVDVPGARWRPIADVRLRGIAEPVRVYELVHASVVSQADAEAFALAFAAMRDDPASARRQFSALPQDALTGFQLARLAGGDSASVLDV